MEKTFLVTLIALSINSMSWAQSNTENTAKTQAAVQQEFVIWGTERSVYESVG